MMLLAFASLMFACDNEDDASNTPDISSGNKTSGFLITGTTGSGDNTTTLVKYLEEIPSGTVDLSDGTDFSQFWPTAIFNHEVYMTRTDKAAGFAKMVVDQDGQIVEGAVIATTDESSFRIAVRDAELGVFQDRADPNRITIFNPTTFQVTGSIDMSAALDPIDTLEQRYQRFVFRGDHVFAPIRANVGTTFQGFYLHQANVASKEYVGSTFIANPRSGSGVLTVNNFGQGLVDDNGDLYFQDGGAIGSGTFSRVYKIPAGSNEIDENYVFEPVKQLNPANIFYPTMNGFKLVGNGKAIAKVNAETPQAAIDLITDNGGLQNVLGNQDLINQILGILFTAESAQWCELDLTTQAVSPILGAPKLGANSTGAAIFEHEGEIYFPVSNESVQAFYKYTPGNPTATKAFDVTGADLSAGYNIANNN